MSTSGTNGDKQPHRLRWLLFGAGLAVVPVAAAGLANEVTGTGGFWGYVERGDLLLVSAVLGGTALGELVGTPNTNAKAAVTAGGGIAANAFFAAILYPFVSVAAEADKPTLDSSSVIMVSLISLVVTLIAGAQCVRVARESET